MICYLVMKTPDAADAVLENLNEPYCGPKEKAKAKQMMSSVLEYGAYLTVMIDTKKETLTVRKKDGTYWN